MKKIVYVFILFVACFLLSALCYAQIAFVYQQSVTLLKYKMAGGNFYENESKKSSSNLDINVSTEKEVFFEDEPIKVRLNIMNKGDVDETIFNFSKEYDLVIEDNNKNVLPYKGIVYLLSRSNDLVFKPNEVKSWDIDILTNFGNVERSVQLYAGNNRYFKEGIYTVYWVKKEQNLKSNTTTLEIKYPEGEEENNLRKLREIFNYKTNTDIIDGYHNFFETTSSSSVYYQEAFKYYLSLSHAANKDQKVLMLKDMLNYINANKNNDYLYIVFWYIKNLIYPDVSNDVKETFENEISQLIKDNPDKTISLAGKKFLNEIK